MSTEYEVALQGTRKEVETAVQRIRDELARNGSKESRTAKYTQFKLCLKVLHSLCYVLGKEKGDHTDIYCNIVIDITGPCMQPEAGGTYWSSYLECLRYIHYQFMNKKHYAFGARIFALLRSMPNKLQSESDFKALISICCQHLYTPRVYMQVTNAIANEVIESALKELTALFSTMLARNKELNFQYTNMLEEFMKHLIPKHTAAIFNHLASLPSALKLRMFEAFFELLAKMKAPQPKSSDVLKQFQAHIQALARLIQLDGAEKLQHKFALEYLRNLREVSWILADEAVKYTTTITYYYVRTAYTTVKTSKLKETYIEVCAKLSSFFKKLSGSSRANEEWFADFVVAMSMLQGQMQQKNPDVFGFFWQEINNLKCYAAHFELIFSLIQFAENMKDCKFGTLKCCTKVRQHTILSLALTAIGAYTSLMLTTKEPTEQSDSNRLSELNRTVTLIFQRAISAIQQLDCLTGTTGDLRMFYARFAQMTREVQTPKQAAFCVSLGELLVPIKDKFDRFDWTLMLRRIYKTSIITKNDKEAIDIHACYVLATLASVKAHGDSNFQLLHNQVEVFYACFTNGTYRASCDKCLLELYLESNNVFKEPLQSKQKDILFWLEMQHFLTYERKNVALQQSLMSLCTSEYDYNVLARGGKLQDVVACSLANMCDRYCGKLAKGCVKRLDRLSYAHACCRLLSHENEKEKASREVDMSYCMEKELATLLEKKCVRTVRLDSEIRRIKLAEEAIQAFEEFFNRADAEPISADEALIDWESLLEDLGTLALYLQLAGYVDVATRAWVLHYKISNMTENIYSAMRGLSYFCEYAHALKNMKDFCLETEVTSKGRLIWFLLKESSEKSRRQQNCMLICLCQLAYYVAYNGNLWAALLLLERVKARHQQLPDRRGKYDVVLATIDTVRFRIVWKHFSIAKKIKHTPLSLKNLLCQIDILLEKFQIISVSAGDFYAYSILLFTLVQDAGECSANRMWQSAVYSFMPCVMKMALQTGCALRTVQVVSTWAMLNLQQEYVRKAEIKLKLCEYFMCVATIDEVLKFNAAQAPLDQPDANLDMSFNELLAVNSIATMRKVTHHPLSPVKATMNHTPNRELQNFLDFSVHELVAQNEIFQWCFFMLGCLNARLLYLVADYTQLADFYEKCYVWLQQREESSVVLKCFQHYGFIQLRQHVNYLRAIEFEKESQKYIAIGLKKCIEADRDVDTVYYLNLRVQLMASQHHLRNARTDLFNKRELILYSASTKDITTRKVSPPSTVVSALQTPHAKSKIYPAITPKITFTIYNSEDEKVDRSALKSTRRRIRPPVRVFETDSSDTSPSTSSECSKPEKISQSAKKSAKTPKTVRKTPQAVSMVNMPKETRSARSAARRVLEHKETIVLTDSPQHSPPSSVIPNVVQTSPKKTRGRPKKQVA